MAKRNNNKRGVQMQLSAPMRERAAYAQGAADYAEGKILNSAAIIVAYKLYESKIDPVNDKLWTMASLLRDIRGACRWANDIDLRNMLQSEDITGQLFGALGDWVLALSNASISAADRYPENIRQVQAYIAAVNVMVQSGDRKPLIKICSRSNDMIGASLRDLFTDDGNLKRQSETTSEDEYIGDQLLPLTVTRSATEAARTLRDELQQRQPNISPVEQAALYHLNNWLDDYKPDARRQAIGRCLDRAKTRLETK